MSNRLPLLESRSFLESQDATDLRAISIQVLRYYHAPDKTYNYTVEYNIQDGSNTIYYHSWFQKSEEQHLIIQHLDGLISKLTDLRNTVDSIKL